jgi:ABC-2 type transport system permease protein
MNTLSEALPDAIPEARDRAAGRTTGVRPLYWSLRRELWESRSLYIAPLIVAGLVLFGFFVGVAHIPGQINSLQVEPRNRAAVTTIPYAMAAIAIMVTGLVVASFYCLGALHNERRDRSILFWKSMPISDLKAVLVKASVPLVAVPVILFVVIFATQLVMLAVSAMVLLPSGVRFATLWSQWPIFRMSVVLAYGLVTETLWYAPVWGWLLMVSAWARRAPFLWAILPPIGLCIIEMFAFGTGHFSHFLAVRLGGGFDAAFSDAGPRESMVDLAQIDPGRFFGSLEFWGGLVVGAGFLAAAVWLRRTRDPV